MLRVEVEVGECLVDVCEGVLEVAVAGAEGAREEEDGAVEGEAVGEAFVNDRKRAVDSST